MNKSKMVGLVALLLSSLALVGCGPKEPDAEEIGKKVAQQVTSESGVDVEFDSAEIVSIDPAGEKSDNITVNVILKSKVNIYELVGGFHWPQRIATCNVYKAISDIGTKHEASAQVYARYLDGEWSYKVQKSKSPTLPNLNARTTADNILAMIMSGNAGAKTNQGKFVTSLKNEITDFSNFDKTDGLVSILVTENTKDDLLKRIEKKRNSNQAIADPLYADYKVLESESKTTKDKINSLYQERSNLERKAKQENNVLYSQFEKDQRAKFQTVREACNDEFQKTGKKDRSYMGGKVDVINKAYEVVIKSLVKERSALSRLSQKNEISAEDYRAQAKENDRKRGVAREIKNKQRDALGAEKNEILATRRNVYAECELKGREQFKVPEDSYETMVVKKTEESLVPIDQQISDLKIAYAPYIALLNKKETEAEVYVEIDQVLAELFNVVGKVEFN